MDRSLLLTWQDVFNFVLLLCKQPRKALVKNVWHVLKISRFLHGGFLRHVCPGLPSSLKQESQHTSDATGRAQAL